MAGERRALVARIERSDIRDRCCPHVRCAHAGYAGTAYAGLKPRLLQCRAGFRRRQRIQKRLHRRPLFARDHQREIIMLFRQRNEA